MNISSRHAVSLLVLLAWAVAITGRTVEAEPLQLPAIQVLPVEDSASGRAFELYIKLPEDYDPGSDRKYPVLYGAEALWHIEVI